MNIIITETTTISEAQKMFHQAYPFLKLEFSDKPHAEGAPTLNGHWYDPVFRLRTISKRPHDAVINIHPWIRTGELEQQFLNEFGLYPQVFRREGERWIQTAGTDIFTLDEQNCIGKNLSARMYGESPTASANLL